MCRDELRETAPCQWNRFRREAEGETRSCIRQPLDERPCFPLLVCPEFVTQLQNHTCSQQSVSQAGPSFQDNHCHRHQEKQLSRTQRRLNEAPPETLVHIREFVP